MNPTDLATNFLNSYYNTMMGNRKDMIKYYRENSQMSYEGDSRVGIAQIMDKIEGLSFKTIQYKFEGYESQQTLLPNSLLLLVNGTLQMDGADTFNFYQCFMLVGEPNGSFFLANDIFKLILG